MQMTREGPSQLESEWVLSQTQLAIIDSAPQGREAEEHSVVWLREAEVLDQYSSLSCLRPSVRPSVRLSLTPLEIWPLSKE